MSDTIDGTGRIRSFDGDLVLDLDDDIAYELVSWSDDEEVSDVSVNESPGIDGDAEDLYKLAATVIEVQVRIKGASWPQVEARRMALSAATKAEREWLLEREIEGVSTTWLARRPLSNTSPITTEDILNLQRLVVLRIPVQPSPTITGLEP